jgi:2-dehydro-3-deoxy-D-arabinonate dehydratase
MKLVQFYLPGEGNRVGILDGEVILDITEKNRRSVIELMEAAYEAGEGFESFLQRQWDQAKKTKGFSFRALNIPPDKSKPHLLIPIFPPEVWGAGVTYKRSAEMRDEDVTLQQKARSSLYDYVYNNPRPELFFKATAPRCVGPNDYITIRSDSKLTAAEPEIAFVIGKNQDILGYTISNDVSAWDIERENPLYLPQSKIFMGCCALGPVLVTPSEIDPYNLNMTCRILRNGKLIFEGSVHTSRIKRTFKELSDYLHRDNFVPMGTTVSTGTGIMIPNEYALKEGDYVEITVDGIGTLSNPVKDRHTGLSLL